MNLEFLIGNIECNNTVSTVSLQLRKPTHKEWHTVECHLDTGATCNVMNRKDYLRITGRRDLRGITTSRARLRLYDGSIMRPLGSCTMIARRNDVEYPLMFQVVDSPQKSLLSVRSCQDLGFVTIHPVSSLSSCDPLILKYDDVFQGIGCFNGDLHLITNQSIKPVQHTPRRVPLHIRSALKTKLDELMSLNIIKPVTEPTEWISSLVIVKKKSGQLRICIDPKDLNRALQRPIYAMPILEEILPRLANASYSQFWMLRMDSFT